MEEQRTRRLVWEGCLNARDLGGYPTADGRETRWGAVVRSDTIAPLTQAGQAALIAYGIRSIVDLRLPDEREQRAHPFAQPGPHGIAYASMPLVGPFDTASPDFTTMVEQYRRMLDDGKSAVAAVMAAIAEAPEGGVVVHCTYGKDRTGLIAAFLLELAGVPRETIAADYALTAECLRPVVEEFLERGPGERADRERELERWTPWPEVALEALELIDERYGGVEAYLLAAGVMTGDITRLRERLLPSVP